MTKSKDWITLTDAVKLYGLKRHQLYYYIKMGVVETQRLSKAPKSKMYISVSSIPAFLRR